MGNLDNIYSAENVRLIVGSGHNDAILYGNTRNYVSVTVYFNGKYEGGGIADLSKVKLGLDNVRLINQKTGCELSQRFDHGNTEQIIYSIKSNIYWRSDVKPDAPVDQDNKDIDKRAKVTYYIYGRAQTEVVNIVGVMIWGRKPGALIYSSRRVAIDFKPQLVEIRVLPEIRYGTHDIEPLEWVETKSTDKYQSHWDLYIKLDEKLYPDNKWVYSEFDFKPINTKGQPASLFAKQNDDEFGLYYMMWPVASQAAVLKVPCDNEEYSMTAFKNISPGALNIALCKGDKVKSVAKADATIRLYDIYGNMGTYQLTWKDAELRINANNWQHVTSVENISFEFTANHNDEAVLYGNTRHCIAVTVCFDGRDKNGKIIDLGGESFNDENIQLIDQETGEDLPREFGEEFKTCEIMYSSKSNMYCLDPVASNEDGIKRAKITFYVYGRTQTEEVRFIGLKVIGTAIHHSTAERVSDFKPVKICVLPEIRYGTYEIEPLEWVETKSTDKYQSHWDLYIKLDEKLHPDNKWIYSEFDFKPINTKGQPASLFAKQNDDELGLYYMMWPVASQTTVLKIPCDNEEHSMTAVRNSSPGALNITLCKGDKASSVAKADATIRLYDIYGNMGTYQLTWKDAELRINANNWQHVTSVENISFEFTANQNGEAVLYGNKRHCVPITVCFDGRDKDGKIIDLGGVLIADNYIRLIDQKTGACLHREFAEASEQTSQITHSTERNMYCPDPVSSNEEGTKRAKVTFYVYGYLPKRAENMKYVGFRFNFHEIHEKEPQDTIGLSKFVRIRLLPEIRYGMSDLKPINWIKPAESKFEFQMDLFLKLNDKNLDNKWIHSETENTGEIVQSNQAYTLINSCCAGYWFYHYVSWKVESEAETITAASSEIARTRLPGALNITVFRTNRIMEEVNPEVVFRLYDIYGNEGRYRIDWIDCNQHPYGATIIADHWDLIKSVDNISYLVDGKEKKAILHANDRHCVALTVYFNGYDRNGDIVDLSEDKFDMKQIRLTEIILDGYYSSNLLPKRKEISPQPGISYSSKKSRFCSDAADNPKVNTDANDVSSNNCKRGKVTYYVYAREVTYAFDGQQENIKRIGACFHFYDGSSYEILPSSSSYAANINVLPERKYTTNDLEPILFERIVQDSERFVRWDAYIRLKKNIHWVYSEFDDFVKVIHDSCFASHFLDNRDSSYEYFMWPIGPQGIKEFYYGGWYKFTYNKAPGALHLIKTKGDLRDTFLGNVVLRLYDARGIEGRFKFDWNKIISNPTKLTLIDA